MRRVRFIHRKENGRYAWRVLAYLRPEPPKMGADFEDFIMESSGDFGTEAEAKHNQEEVERKLGLAIEG